MVATTSNTTEKKLTLVTVIPWEPDAPPDADLRAYQREDYEAIKAHFEAAGITVDTTVFDS